MSTYAIVETGSKQYRVEPKTILEVEKFEVAEGQKEVSLDKVLFIRNGENVTVGTPVVSGAKVICDYLGEFKGPKVVHFRFRRRKNSRRKKGHRQPLVRLQVKEIQTGK
jgi:large subunit ribosomal protein L21